MANDATVLLSNAWHEARHVHQRQQRNIESVAETDELAALVGGVNVQHTRHHVRLVGNHTHGASNESTETDHQVLGVASLHLKEITMIYKAANDFANVIALLAFHGNNVPKLGIWLNNFVRINDRWLFRVVLGQEAQ